MRKLLIAVTALAVLLWGSCSLDTEDTGSLTISLSSSELQSRTIVPTIDMTIASYTICLTAPNGEEFEDSVPAETTVYSRDGLSVGTWSVRVEAHNSVPELIGESETVEVTIERGQTASPPPIEIRPVAGTGTLDVTVSWPAGSVPNASVEAYLDSDPMTFTLGTNEATYTNSSVPTGYHRLSVQLYDGTTVLSGFTESVRIIDGQTTTATLELSPNTGSLALTLVPQMEEPLALTLTGQVDMLVEGEEMTVALNTGGVSLDSCAWYSDGGFVAEETQPTGDPSITIGSTLSLGLHRLDVYVTAGSVSSSASVEFEVKEAFAVTDIGPAGGYVFYDKGGYSDGWRYMEVAPSEQGSAVWSPGPPGVSTSSWTIESGDANSTIIVAAYGPGTYAAAVCDDLSLGGYDDWFLPSINSLYEIHRVLKLGEHNDVIGDGIYWSSYSGPLPYGWWMGAADETIPNGDFYSEFDSLDVRAVRKF